MEVETAAREQVGVGTVPPHWPKEPVANHSFFSTNL